VAKLLKELGFSLRANQKKKAVSSVKPQVRDEQFKYINAQRKSFTERKAIILSVDTKKKELIGSFKNDGRTWTQEAVIVNDHDFRSQADGLATPYGIYDLSCNHGAVYVGTSCDTPWFATDCLALWYSEIGFKRYPDTLEMLILADGGGSNRVGSYVWKYGLQSKLCDAFGLSVTVCHYPPGTSKWNPIEHRLFSEISKNWAGRPLESYETMLNYIQTTKTNTGLSVSASLIEGKYTKGMKATREEVAALNIVAHSVQPKRNYTLHPQQVHGCSYDEVDCQRTDDTALTVQKPEVIFV